MPRYFFNIEGDKPDAHGTEIEGIAKARCQAVERAGRIMCEESGTFWKRKDWSMTVTNHDGLTLFSLTLFATESASTGHSLEQAGYA